MLPFYIECHLKHVILSFSDYERLTRYGFNSHGHTVVRERLKCWERERKKSSSSSSKTELSKLVGVNLGKNAHSVDAVADYVRGVGSLGPCADYIVVNVSSPNTPGLRDMQGRKQLEHLLDQVRGAGRI